jgi:hypothetical protein
VQLLADIPTRAVHEQDAGKRLEEGGVDRDRLQFVPEHFVQTKAEKGGGLGRKALMESFATETRGQRGHHAPQRRMRQPQLAQRQ